MAAARRPEGVGSREGDDGIMKSEKEMREEVRRIRERVKGLSGFWIGEASAAIYALEWAVGKRESPPSEDLGRPRGGREKIAAALVALAAKAPPPRVKPKTRSRSKP
jgi:hypothetical protein